MSICHICLRTDKKVQKVNQKLGEFLDDICEFVTLYSAEYCSECTQILKKFYKFREKCMTAVKILKKWKKLKDKHKTPWNLLHTELPQSQLSLCNMQNCKVYFYQETVPTMSEPTNSPYMIIDPNKLQPSISNTCNNVGSPVKSPANKPYIVIDPSKPLLHVNCNIDNDLTILTDNDNNDKANGNGHCDEVVENNESVIGNDKNYTDNDSCVTNVEYLDDDILSIDVKSEENEDPLREEYLELAESDDNVDPPHKEYVEVDTSNDAEYLEIDYDEVEYLDTDLLSDTEKKIKSFVIDKLNETPTDVSNKDNITKDATNVDMMNNEELARVVKQLKEDLKDHDYVVPTVENITQLELYNKNKVYKHVLDVELIKNMLKIRFDKAGEVKSEDGTVIDKNVILNCLDKLPPARLKHVFNCIKNTTIFKPKAIQLFSKLQNIYKMDCEGGFTVRYLQTNEEVTEEFNRRQYRESYISSAFKCTTCIKGFQYKKALESHMSTSHDKRALYVCPLCHTRYRTSTLLSKHRHKHRTICKCKLCPYVTSNREAMEVHYKKHKGILAFKCKACPEKFNNRSILYKHQSKCRGSAVVCSSCARKFTSPLGLTQHRNRKHRDEVTDSADSVTCVKCHVTFVSVHVYRRHLVMYKTHGCRALFRNDDKKSRAVNKKGNVDKLNLDTIVRLSKV